jgi:uncharacterized protein YjeT (DUF2065 family)
LIAPGLLFVHRYFCSNIHLIKQGLSQMWETFLNAVALMLVLEGMLPFLSPQTWREAFKKMTEIEDSQIRFIGLTSMLMGLALLLVVS